MWAFVALVSLIHIVSAVLYALGALKGALTYVLVGIDAIAHIALFAVALIIGVKAEELFLAVMISAAVGMLSVFVSEKIALKHASAQAVGEEDKNGI